jgi:hypothetical protein
MGRADLIGNGKKHLVPAWQPVVPKAAGPVAAPNAKFVRNRKPQAFSRKSTRTS